MVYKSNSKQILAWNGGGISNYSKIISKGSYDAKVDTVTTLPFDFPSVEAVEESIKKLPGYDAVAAEKAKLKEVVSEVVDEVLEKLHITGTSF